ncbi:MAG: sensor histidine kinase [Bacteroidales bacterium]
MISLDPKTRRIASVALHFLVWTFWFAAPILLSFNRSNFNEPPRDPSFLFVIWIPMVLSLIMFYLNYFVFVDRLLFNRRFVWFFLINLVLVVGASFLADLIRDIFFQPLFSGPWDMHKPPREFTFKAHHLTFLFVVSISVAIKTTGRWYKGENQRKNLENENLRSELNNLKMQLNPHFFFNTLNNIYSLIQTSPERAQESVHGLAKLMRYHLYETNEDSVALEGEIEFIKSYIDLMKLRFSSTIEVITDFSIENSNVRIAPLLFIPLIENAFKHGVNPLEKSIIKISLQEKNRIVSFESFNTDFPQKYQTDKEEEANGIGLENIQKRLSLIYPGKFIFVKNFVDELFHVKLVIQL